MRLRLVPREESFFELFEEMARKVGQGADELLGLLHNYKDLDRRAGRVVDIEHEGDEITHEVMRRLNTTFVTPFDREDIYRLASALDDILDYIEAAAEYLSLHKIDEPLPQMVSLAESLSAAARRTAEAMPNLRKMRNLETYWVEINRLENEGDRIYRQATASLFGGNFKAMDVLKWKEVIDELEAAIDRLEDVANTLEGIALKET